MAKYCASTAPKGKKVHEMVEYATELGRIDGISLEELKRKALQFRSVGPGFDFSLSNVKPWLETRMKTFQNISIPLDTMTGLIAADKPRKLLREFVVMEKIFDHIKQEGARMTTSKGWLNQAKENQKQFQREDLHILNEDTRNMKRPLMKKLSPSQFMGTPGISVGERSSRVQHGNRQSPGCARCTEATTYINEKGLITPTLFIVSVEGHHSLQVCRACFKMANAQAAKPHSMKMIKMKDRLKVSLSKQEVDTFFSHYSPSSKGGCSVSGKEEQAAGMYENRGRGTDADPILLNSSDDEPDEKKKATSPRYQAVVNPCQRRTRRTSKVETDSILDELKCSMPPEGGLGAVTFMLRDYFKLRPLEFMNDSCIDYFFKHLEVTLKEENPKKWQRCYFFNSFFYKKLTDDKSVSLLSDETKALVDRPLGELDRLSLQALRCYDVTKRWTKNVDLFSKDYLFIPIHDHLHWSLIIVCHPGSGSIKRKGILGNDPEAFMLHLDSMQASGGHNSDAIGKLIRRYLQNEWKAKLQQEGESIPKSWVQQHPGVERDFLRMVVRRPQVPIQENHYDCGSFVCAFLDHFVAVLPSQINTQMVPTARKGRNLMMERQKKIFPAQPTFLTRKWFSPDNASNLRHHLAIMALKAMAVNANLMDNYGRWKMEGLSQEQQHKMTFLMHSIENLASEKKYLAPSWDIRAVENEKEAKHSQEENDNTDNIDIQELDASQGSDPIDNGEYQGIPIASVDNSALEIEDSSVYDIEEAAVKNLTTPADGRARLRQIKKRKDLRNTPDVDIIEQLQNREDLQESRSRAPVTFSKRKNRFAKKSKPSLIPRSQGGRIGLADCYQLMSNKTQKDLRTSFNQRTR